MTSEAGWQSGSTMKHGSAELPHGEGAMDQRTVESLLRRLVERVEESERRYGEALEELHSRLDQLSHTTEAARATSTPEDADTLHRLHDQVSSLARRLEHETDIPLDDFERLGKVLSGARHYEEDDAGKTQEGLHDAASEFRPTPAPPSFWQAAQEPSGRDTAFSFPPVQPDFSSPISPSLSPEGYENGLDKRLVDIAQRLEQSIGTAMPTTAIESLNRKMEEISAQLAKALSGTSQREGLEHIERQISDMGEQLGRAEAQIGRLGSIETQLLTLIERVDTMPKQIEETATKAATEAARRVADEARPGPEKRFDAIEGKLTSIGDESRASSKRLSETLAAVHASLKELLQQIEKGPSPFARPARMPVPDRLREGSSQPSAGAADQAPVSRAEAPVARVERDRPRQDSDETVHAEPKEAPRQDRSLRSRLGAAIPDYRDHESEAQASFGRAKRAKLDEDAVDLDAPEARAMERAKTDFEMDSTDDLVAAARRAAQAAAVQAEERTGGSRAKRLRTTTSLTAAEAAGGRTRPLLMVIAALLLVVSAALLYTRLKTKPDPEATPPATEETIPAPYQKHGTGVPGEKSGEMDLPPVRYGNANVVSPSKGVSEVTKSRPTFGYAGDGPVKPTLASLKPTGMIELPPGVTLSVEEGIPDASQHVASSVGMPPASLGPLALRQAAAKGDPKAQYIIALRYLKFSPANFAEAARWFGYAASAGLAPAQYRLATMYERGQGVTKDAGRARSWYGAAAEKGNIKAMHNLAVSESGREGGITDYEAAFKWYVQAASYGLADSQFNLGILAEHGLGMTKSLPEAYKWFALAAAQGDVEAGKRRDLIKAQLDAPALAEAEQSVKAWAPKTEAAEANEIEEAPIWAAEAEAKAAIPSSNAELITRAQRLLNKLGYDVGVPDGQLGDRTRTAIETFQRKNGQEATGEVSIPLVTRLERLTS